jgi:hypothetical protein
MLNCTLNFVLLQIGECDLGKRCFSFCHLHGLKKAFVGKNKSIHGRLLSRPDLIGQALAGRAIVGHWPSGRQHLPG